MFRFLMILLLCSAFMQAESVYNASGQLMRWFDQDWSLGCGVAHGDDTTQGECGVGFALPVYQRGGHEIGAAIDLGRHVGMALFWEGYLTGNARLNFKAGYGMRGNFPAPALKSGLKSRFQSAPSGRYTTGTMPTAKKRRADRSPLTLSAQPWAFGCGGFADAS